MAFHLQPPSTRCVHCAPSPRSENFLAPRHRALCENHSKLCLTKRKNYKQINLHKSQQQQEQRTQHTTIVTGLAAETFMKQSGKGSPVPSHSLRSGGVLGLGPLESGPGFQILQIPPEPRPGATDAATERNGWQSGNNRQFICIKAQCASLTWMSVLMGIDGCGLGKTLLALLSEILVWILLSSGSGGLKIEHDTYRKYFNYFFKLSKNYVKYPRFQLPLPVSRLTSTIKT